MKCFKSNNMLFMLLAGILCICAYGCSKKPDPHD